MAKLKGMKKLNKAILSEVQRFGIKKVDCEPEFSYAWKDEKIGYKVVVDETDNYFDEFVNDRFDFPVEYDFIISILHEVGHRKTGDDIQGDLYDFCLAEKERLFDLIALEADEEKIKKYYFQYFNLPDEIMATQWAVNYMKKHPRITKKMMKNMGDAIQDFYKINNVIDDEDLKEIAGVI